MSSDAARYFLRISGTDIERGRAQIEAALPSSIDDVKPQTLEESISPSNIAELVAQSTSRSTEISDEVLIARVCAGDKEALAQLFRRYARLVRTVAYRILRDGAEADDLLQDVFLFINRKCETFDGSKGSARSWIVQITYHRSIDRRRYLCSRHFYTQVNIDDPAMEVSDPRADVPPYDQSIEGVLGRTGLEKMRKSLSEDQWTTMRLFFFEGFTIEEIAVHLEQSPGNVRNHYYRGLEKVRKQMCAKKLRAD